MNKLRCFSVISILMIFSIISEAQTYTDYLQQGKIHLNNQNYPAAFERFSMALENAKSNIEKKDAESLKNASFKHLQKQYNEMELTLRARDTTIKKLRQIIETLYFYDNRLSLGSKDGKFGFINKQGKTIIPFIYDDAAPFDVFSGFAIVSRNHTRYLIDTTGAEYLLSINLATANSGTLAIDLRNQELHTIPNPIFSCSNLKILLLGNNKIELIPAQISKLRNLQYLDLSNNRIEKLPEEFGTLTNLKFLSLSKNQIGKLPDSFSQLIILQELKLDDNNLFILTQGIGSLYELTFLNLNNNKLNTIPKELGKLKNLKTLHIQRNDLEKLPDEIGNMDIIENIYLNENEINDLPASIGKLKRLQRLDLSRNKIGNIPMELKSMNWLKEFDLRGNSIPSDKKGMIKSWFPNCNIQL